MSSSSMGLQSRVENLDLGSTVCHCLCQLMSPCFTTFTRASLLHGHLDSSFQTGYKMPICLRWEQLNDSAMFLFYLPSRALTSSDPPWSIFSLWRSWVARRILVYRVIMLLILAPHWARRPVIVVRRILVISPESSLYAHKDVLVFARARMFDHLPLVIPPNTHRESLRLFPHSSSIYWGTCWAYVRRATFLSLGYNFIDGPMWLGSQWISALWKFELPSIQRFGLCNLGK